MAKNEVKRKDHLIDATGRIIVSCCSSVNKILVNSLELGPTIVAWSKLGQRDFKNVPERLKVSSTVGGGLKYWSKEVVMCVRVSDRIYVLPHGGTEFHKVVSRVRQ